jgi:hypothetical protein
MEIGNEFHVGLIAELLLRTHIRWCKDPITGRELMLDPGCWILENMKRPFKFYPASLRGVSSTLRPVCPPGWKRSRRPVTSIQDLSNYSTELDIKIELNLKKLK